MSSSLADLEIEAAATDVRQAVERLLDLTLSRDPEGADEAAHQLRLIRSTVAEAVLAAYTRARTSLQRERLIRVLDNATPPWYPEARDFLEDIAYFEPDEDIRAYAKEISRALYAREALEDDW